MTYFHGQPVIWYKRNSRAHAPEYRKLPATFLEPRGRESARINVAGEVKVVRLASIEAVRERPVLLRSGAFHSN